MAALSGFVVLSGMFLIVFIIGLHNFLTGVEENGCEMTYMFEYPQYVKISLSPNVTKHYSRYGLHAYGEGQFTERLRQMKFNGIPVLFIPGNSGSYKQVRSLASVSLRKAISSHVPFHFDYFTVDLNDEYSGLFGGILKDQTEFVHHCIKKILRLYRPGPYSPVSVILIGHSMGGMVAKGVFLNNDFDASLVRVIITLATPHKTPAIAIDRHLTNYHSQVNAYWIANKINNGWGNLSHVNLISIGGGHRDLMVRSGLTEDETADVNVLSTAIPGVWLSTDHLCSMWCKDLVLVIVRSLFDVINMRTKQVTDNVMERRDVFHYHLLKRSAGKRIATAFHPREVFFSQNGVWNEYLRRQISVTEFGGVRTVTHIMVRLVDDPKHELLAVKVLNIEAGDWVFACTASVIHASSRTCDSGINLSNETQLLPSKLSKKFIHLNLIELREKSFTHVILRLLPTTEKVQLDVDVHSMDRRITISPPMWLSFIMKSTIIPQTDENSLYYEIAIASFEHSWQAYLLHIVPNNCRQTKHEATARMEVPWSKEDVYVKITETVQKPLHLKLQSPKPLSYTGNETVKVHLVLDPSCRYTVSIQSSVLDTLGQFVRFYTVMLPPYVAAVLVLTLRRQLLSLAETGQCVMFHTALASGAKPYYILPAVKMGSRIVGLSVLVRLLYPFLSQFDPLVLAESNLDFFLLPFILYMVAFALAYLLGLGCWLSVIFSGHTAHKMALRFLAKSLTGTMTWSEWAFAAMSRLPVTVAASLIALSYSTCGALSVCVGAVFYYLKLCKMYEDYLEDLLKYSIHLLTRKRKKTEKESKKNQPEKKHEEKESKKNQPEKKHEENKNKDNQPEKKHEGDNTKESLTEKENEVDKVEKEEKQKEISQERANDQEVQDETKVGEGSKKNVEVSFDKNNQTVKKVKGNGDRALEKKEDGKNGAKIKEVSKKNSSSKKYSGSLSELHFSFTSLLLWFIAAAVNVPSVLVWAHNYSYSTKLQPDPSFATSIVLCFCAGVLWQRKAPIPNLAHYDVVSHLLYIIAVLILTFSTISLHHLSPLLTSAFVIITLHQVFGGFFSSPITGTPDTSLLGDKKLESKASVPTKKLKDA